MSTQPFKSTSASKSRRRIAARTAIAVCAVLAFSTRSLLADATGQAEINAFLGTKNVQNASAPALVSAVAKALASSSNSVTAADLAASAFQPFGGLVRKDRDTTAPLVAASVVGSVISSDSGAALTSSSSAVAESIAAVVDQVVTVNGTDPAENLDSTGQGNVIKSALSVISTEALTTPTLLLADETIGATLASDATFSGESSEITALEDGIAGITGVKSKAPAEAPVAAEDFVTGLISTGVPGSLTYPVFAEDILTKVYKNTTVDELVAYAIGQQDSGGLVGLGTTLFARYPKAVVKLTQGLTAASPQGVNNENTRATFVNSLTAADLTAATGIAEGSTFTDPFYSYAFTHGVFDALIGSGGESLAGKYAAGIASGVGAELGQDGFELTEVANVYSYLTGSNDLEAANAPTYAKDLIKSAVTSSILPSAFTEVHGVTGSGPTGGGGGKLPVGNGKSSTTVSLNIGETLASILDLFADGIINQNGTGSTAAIATDAKELAKLSKDVAAFGKNENVSVTIGQSSSEPIGVYLAGTLGDYVAGLSLGSTAQTALFAAIVKGVDGAVNGTIKHEVGAVFGADPTYTEYTPVGVLSTPETTVTNL